MVDLVKIRKKAKKKEEESAQPEVSPARADSPAPAPEPPASQAAAAGEGAPASAHPASAAEPQPSPVANPSPERDAAPPPATAPSSAAAKTAVAEELAQGSRSKLERFKEQAGRRRTTGETAAVEQTAAGKVELLTFVIAGEQYAVDIERIVEIVTPRGITHVPNADESIVGIISLRGTIVTLVDARRRLKHVPAGEPTADTRIVVIDMKNETIGFIVDRVLRVIKADQSEIEPHPVVHNTELDESILGVFGTSSALTILLDLDKLLESRTVAASSA